MSEFPPQGEGQDDSASNDMAAVMENFKKKTSLISAGRPQAPVVNPTTPGSVVGAGVAANAAQQVRASLDFNVMHHTCNIKYLLGN
jgi:hypothetical protein